MNGIAGGIAWEDRGRVGAQPLLLVRPLGGSVALWGDFARVLERDLRVVSFDARGTGDSTGHPRVSTRSLAADAISVLDARGIACAHVFGISLGGMVATRLAIGASSRVASLIVASAPTRGVAFERAGFLRAFNFARCCAHTPRETERCIVTRVLSREFRAHHPAEATRIEELAARTPSPHASILAHVIAAARHDVRGELGRVRTRTLILAGDRDHLLGPKAGLDLERGIEGSSRLVIEGAGHDLTLERPQETAARVLDLVLRVGAGDSVRGAMSLPA